jgi:hypothetical protein
MTLLDKPLSREELKQIVEGKGAARRVPMSIHEWIIPDAFGDRSPIYQAVLDQYPCDIKKYP